MRKLILILLLILLIPAGSAFAEKAPRALPLTIAFGDGNSEVLAIVIQQLRNSDKFDVLAFSPDLPTITRAVMERKIPADVARNPADAQKAVLVASAVGAQYAIRIQGKVEGPKATVTLELLKVPEGRWTTTAESDIASGDGPRAAINRNNAISTAVSSAVSQILIAAFGGLPETKPTVVEPPKVETPVTTAAPETPKTTETEPPRDVTAEYNEIIKVVESFVTKGDLRNAAVTLKRAVNLEPDKPTARVRLAKIYADLGMTAEAIDECKRTLLFDKDSAPVYVLLAKLYMANGSMAEAAEQWAQVIRLDPKNVEARMSLGDISWNLAKVDDAVAAYEGAVSADPANPAPHERLQRLYAARKMYPQAFEHLVAARSLTEDVGQDPAKKYAVIAQVTQEEFDLVMGKLDSAKADFDSNKISRDEYYADSKDATSRIEALATFLTMQTAPRAYKNVHARGLLAASLMAQAGGDLVSYFETEKKHYLDDADLLQDEAKNAMQDFVTGLKAIAAGQSAVSPKQGNG